MIDGAVLMADASLEEFGRLIRRMRKAERDWSQEELAERAGIDQGTVSAVERAQNKPSAETVIGLARAFGALPQEFLALARIVPDGGSQDEERDVILAVMMAHPQAGPMLIRLKAEATTDEYPALLEEALEHFAIGLGRRLRRRREDAEGA